MFKLWVKKIKHSKMIADTIIINERLDLDLNTLVKEAISSMCIEFDVSHPVWLSKHYKDLSLHRQAKFHSEDFVEEVDFDYIEIIILEYTKID